MDQDIIHIKLGPDYNWHILPAKITNRLNDNSVQAVYFEFMGKKLLVGDFIKSNDGDYWVFKSDAISQPHTTSQSLSRAGSDLMSHECSGT